MLLQSRSSLLIGAGALLTASAALLLSGPQTPPGDALQSLLNVCSAATGLNNPDFALRQPYLFGWKLFLAINCPAQRAPAAPRVWETWKPIQAVYLPGGQEPPPWPSPLPERFLLDREEISSLKLQDRNHQPVLSEIRMNRGTFEYIVQRKLYSRKGQIAFFLSSSPPIHFPADAMEIKAAWLILTPDDPRNSRYYAIRSKYVDDQNQVHPVLVGLASLHITSKILPNWFWTTFEQIDNQQRVPDAPAIVPIPANVQALNGAVHAALPPNSVWRFYNMRGVQLDFTGSDHVPTILANTLLETNFQRSSSCITCHDLSTRGSAEEGRLGLWSNSSNGVQGHIGEVGDKSNHYVETYGHPVCYDAPRNAFTDCNPAKPTVVYKTLDFVWSLKEAN